MFISLKRGVSREVSASWTFYTSIRPSIKYFASLLVFRTVLSVMTSVLNTGLVSVLTCSIRVFSVTIVVLVAKTFTRPGVKTHTLILASVTTFTFTLAYS